MVYETQVKSWERWLRRHWRLHGARLVLVLCLCAVIAFAWLTFTDRATWSPEADVPGSLEVAAHTIRSFAGNLPDEGIADEAQSRVYLVVALALALSITAIFQAIGSGLSRLFSWLILTTNYNNHVVICGLTHFSAALARGYREQGQAVLVVEPDAGHPGAGALMDEGVRIHFGDPTSPEVLRAARLRHARLLVLLSDAETNSEAQHAALVVAREAGVPPIRCHIHLPDRHLFKALQWYEFTNRTDRELGGVRFFNVSERGATLLSRDEGMHKRRGEPIHYVIVGCGSMGHELIASLTRRWALDRTDPETERVHFTIIDLKAEEQVRSIEREYEPMLHWWKLHPVTLDIRTAEFAKAQFLFPDGLPHPARVFVCLNDDSLSLLASLTLLRAMIRRNCGIPIMMRMYQHSGLMRSSVLRATKGPNKWTQFLQPFCILERVMDPDCFESLASLERIAIFLHDRYLEMMARLKDEAEMSGKPFNSSPANVAWEELAEHYRESCRSHAASIALALPQLSPPREFVPIHSLRASEQQSHLTEAEILHLAELEHERWRNEKAAVGWKRGPEPDNAEKFHPDLVPWADLSDSARNKDIDFVRAWQAALAEGDLCIVRKRVDSEPCPTN